MTGPSADTRLHPTAPRPASPLRTALWSGLFLAAALALAARTVVRALERPDVLTPPALPAISDPAERARRLHDIIGTFTTGAAAGDRVIVVEPNGRIRFHLVGPLEVALARSDGYHLAVLRGRTLIVTDHSGPVEALDIDHLGCFGDVYQRTK